MVCGLWNQTSQCLIPKPAVFFPKPAVFFPKISEGEQSFIIFYSSPATLHFYRRSVDVRSHRRISFRQFDFYFFYRREIGEKPSDDSSAHVFQKFRRNAHFFFYGFVHIRIAHRVRHFVRFYRPPDVDFQPQGDEVFIAYEIFLRHYA